MDAPMLELKSALASLFEGGKYSDLTIVCGAKRYPVHRALLATRSTFFEGACRNAFREADTGVIDLSEDDPSAVEHMVYYFYHMDYLSKPLSRRSSQRSSRPGSPQSPRFPRRPAMKKLDLTFLEDPLLASASGLNNTTMPLTPPADEAMFQSLSPSNKMPRTPITDHFTDDEVESVYSDCEPDTEKAHLVTHAKVYAIAEKYDIAGLKALSQSKFAQQLQLHLGSPEFPEACQEAYESTFHTDRGLRDVIIQCFRTNPALSLRPDVEMMIRETPGLAFELFRMASGLPVAS